jgi:hypothetical protein
MTRTVVLMVAVLSACGVERPMPEVGMVAGGSMAGGSSGMTDSGSGGGDSLAVDAGTEKASVVQTRVVAPSSTAPGISDQFGNHLISRGALDLGRLFVFFPGSTARAEAYSAIVETAARQGYHAIGLSYFNPQVVNSLCGGTMESDCLANVRRELIDGVDRTPVIGVPVADAIETRLSKLLAWLVTHHPQEGWSQFLDAQGGVRWEAVVVAGHSQGGGQAAMLAKDRVVARVVCFSSPGDDVNGTPASWLTGHLTASNRYFVVSHQREPNALANTRAADAIGVPGQPFIVTIEPPDAGVTNRLVLTLPPARMSMGPLNAFHASTCADGFTPRSAEGGFAYEAVWKWLIGSS